LALARTAGPAITQIPSHDCSWQPKKKKNKKGMTSFMESAVKYIPRAFQDPMTIYLFGRYWHYDLTGSSARIAGSSRTDSE
jgi:hypothetical protein